MKLLILVLFVFLIQPSSFAQECMTSEYLKKGTKWETSNYNKKGKFTGLTKYEVLNTSHNGRKSIWEIKIEIFDKKRKSVNETSTEIICDNGVYKMDMSQMIPAESMQSMQSMEVEMDATKIDFPIGKTTEMELNDGQITIIAATSGIVIMDMKLTITDRKIEGLETVETEAGTFECLKITQKSQLKSKLITREYTTISWFLPGFGVVKSESYDQEDKLMGSSQLTALTR